MNSIVLYPEICMGVCFYTMLLIIMFFFNFQCICYYSFYLFASAIFILFCIVNLELVYLIKVFTGKFLYFIFCGECFYCLVFNWIFLNLYSNIICNIIQFKYIYITLHSVWP